MGHASKTQRRVLWTAAVAALVAFIAVLAFLAFAKAKVGQTVTGQKEALTITLDAYTSLIELMTLTFGAVAFLVTYQLKKSRRYAATRGAAALASGVR